MLSELRFGDSATAAGRDLRRLDNVVGAFGHFGTGIQVGVEG